MKTTALFAGLAALGLAACTQEAPAPSSTYDLSLYPQCSDEVTVENAPDGCVIASEGMTHALLVQSSEGITSVQVVGDGEAGQLIEVEADGPSLTPDVADLNGDGLLDLLIPLSLGNVNTTRAVFLASPDTTYMPAGEIAGVGWELSPLGLLAVPARSSAASWVVSFYDVEPGGLTLIAEAETTIVAEGAAPTCQLIGTPVLAAQPLEEATAQYCGDPAVAGIWTDAADQ